MEVIMDLKVSKEEYYNYLLNSLYKDILKTVSRKVKRSDIKEGFEFVKKYHVGKNKYEIKNKITKLEPNQNYELVRYSGVGTQLIRHSIKEQSKEEVVITYTENTEANDVISKVKSLTNKRKGKKMMKQMLKQVETDIINKR